MICSTSVAMARCFGERRVVLECSLLAQSAVPLSGSPRQAVVPFPPGGANDIAARLSARSSRAMEQGGGVDNRGGAEET